MYGADGEREERADEDYDRKGSRRGRQRPDGGRFLFILSARNKPLRNANWTQ